MERDAELFLIGFRLRFDGDLDDGMGKSIFSSTTGCCGSHSVSPVVVFFNPPAPRCRGKGFLDVFASLACINSMRPTRSR